MCHFSLKRLNQVENVGMSFVYDEQASVRKALATEKKTCRFKAANFCIIRCCSGFRNRLKIIIIKKRQSTRRSIN